MLVVDASCLLEIVARTPRAEPFRARMAIDGDFVAPHIVDVEVFGAIRRERRLGLLDETAADLAVTRLARWPGQRFGHRPLLRRAWELRDSVRGWDAMYVALAETIGATLITADRRLARALGPRCRIEVVGG